MPTFQFRVKDSDPNVCTVTIESNSLKDLKALIEDVGLDDIITNHKDYNATCEWDDELHQPLLVIEDGIKQLTKDRVIVEVTKGIAEVTQDSDLVEVVIVDHDNEDEVESYDPSDPDNIGCNKYHARKDDELTEGDING